MRKRRFFTLLLGLCTVFMLPMAVSAAEPTEIIVNGEDILLTENNTVACGKGSAVYFGIREGGINSSKNGQADIVIDGGKVDITSAGQGSFSSTGIQAEGDLKILNDAMVTSKGEDTGVIGNAGIEISNSTVNAYATDTEGYQAMVSDNDISIKKSVVDASAASEHGDSAIWAGGMVKITDGSNVKVHDTIYKEIPVAGHTAGADWKSDETGHWKECVDCGAKNIIGKSINHAPCGM